MTIVSQFKSYIYLRWATAARAACAATFVWVSAAYADPLEGVWLTQPDQKGQTAHVVIHPCGQALCGTIERAFDAAGQRIVTPNVGKRLFWDMKPDGRSYVGRAYVPAHNREYPGTITVSGRTMKLKGCLGPVCQSVTWTRVD